MLIAEDLLLLLTDDRTGTSAVPSDEADIALGAAVLVDLTFAGRVHVGPERLVVTDASPTLDELLDEALTVVASKHGSKPKDVVVSLGKGLRARLYGRLSERGLLHEETRRILRVLPAHRWPADDAAHEDLVRTELAQALRVGAAGDPRTGALIALLDALRAVDKVVDPAAVGITKGELNAKARRIAEGDWASEAVRKAIDELLAAIVAATAASAGVAGP